MLRHALLFLTALSLGLLSEKERRDRQKIETLYTTLKDTQEQLIHSEKLASIGTLAAGVAHEINNPLDGIQNCIRSILQEPDDKKKAGHYLGLIQEGLNRIENIVRKLLDFARPSELKMEYMQVNDLLGNSLELVAHRFNNPGIKLNKDFAGNLPLYRGDSHYLQQVFLNIILNALDAMPAGGALTVKTSLAQNAPGGVSLPNTRIEVAVSDTGCGIPQENLSKIFDPFFTTKGVGEGTGLGLAVCTGIIKEHRGEIKVKSAVGKGSTFTVLLPVNPVSRSETKTIQKGEML
jgi:signal transduction histidine kinase